MTLTDPREALAEQSAFIGYLMGLAGLGRVVHALAESEGRAEPCRDADEFVHVLVGIASLGNAVEQLAESSPSQQETTRTTPAADATDTRWLR